MPYEPDFLGISLPLPTLLPNVASDAWADGEPIHHTHHSIVFNQVRSLAVYAAHNVDGAQLVSGIRRRKRFSFDPEVPNQIQLDNDRGYKGFPEPEDNPWDAGHLARRKDVHWPDATTAKQAEIDTSRWTNIAPQHARLNQGPWLEIEDWLLGLADDDNRRMSVFTGPVFTQSDLEWQNNSAELEVRIPAGYWKIGLFWVRGELRAAAFLIWQTDVVPSVDDFRADDFDPILEQVRVLTIEHLAGLSFGDTVRAADPLHFGAAGEAPAAPSGPAISGPAISGPPAEVAPRRKLTSTMITGPGDIII